MGFALVIRSLLLSYMAFAQGVAGKTFQSWQQVQADAIKYHRCDLARDHEGQTCGGLAGGNVQQCPKKK